MEGNKSTTLGVITEEGLKNSQRIKVLKIKDRQNYFIWLSCGMKIEIYETSTVNCDECSTWDDKMTKYEINLTCNIIDIFQLNDLIFVLDADGVLHSFELVIHSSNSPLNFMEVDDLFTSPTSCDTSKWKENIIMNIKNCDCIIGACFFTFGFAALVMKDKCLSVHVYSFPEFIFKFFFDLHKYSSQNAVLSSCKIASLSPSLKLHFQDDLEVLDDEIIVVGLSTGMVLWFSANNLSKGPIVLFNAHHEVQRIHWVEDTANDLISHLLIVLTSGSVIIFGQDKIFTKFLPDSVKASWCLRNHLVTSNLVDCYNSELKITETVDVNSVLLPLKGVSAITKSCDSDTLLAATVHGMVYCFNINAKPPETSISFTIPEEHMLDNMWAQTKNLESIYKQLSEEDNILKAVATAMAANIPQLFHSTLKIISDVEFSLETKLTKTGVIFSHKLWIASVEVTRTKSNKESSYIKLTKDFSSESELQLNARHSLSFGDIVSFELILFLETQQPVLTVPIYKVEIDAGYLMVTQSLVPSISKKEESFQEILCNLNSESTPKRRLQEWKLCLNIPKNINIQSVLPSIIYNSQERISKDEWDKVAGGKKHNIQVNVNSQVVMIHLEIESRELTINSCDIQLCYNIKDAVIKRLKTTEDKHISENVALEAQALNQEFEIESFKDETNFQSLDIIRKRLRSTISCHFLL